MANLEMRSSLRLREGGVCSRIGRLLRLAMVSVGLALAPALSSPAAPPADESPSLRELAQALENLPTAVLPEPDRAKARSMIPEDLGRRIRQANCQSSAEWRRIQNRRDWDRFRRTKLRALYESLGPFPDVPERLRIERSGDRTGDGYRLEKLVFESRPGLWVTAHLYGPVEPAASMPGILICHSHHAPKEHGELQDMGMSWARQGCFVLIPDLLGHGERRQHPFRTPSDHGKPFRVGRQDYYFRYDMGVQLHLLGESLMGYFVWDLWRCVDVLLRRPRIDPQRIILLGAVAGGGDPVAVAAALDPRIQAAVPFNFGGPQPETRYPLPEDAENVFNYAGSGSFESTRNLRRSAGEGFLPWVIVGAIAPRKLIYAHEFAWDRPRDPVWRRLQKIYAFYDAGRFLAPCHGRGVLKGRPPDATHCGNIGREHRRMIHPVFERWFDIALTTETEYSARIEREELRSMTPALEKKLGPRQLCDVLSDLATSRIAGARELLKGEPADDRRRLLAVGWRRVLGNVDPRSELGVRVVEKNRTSPAGFSVERIVLEVEPGISVPVITLLPPRPGGRQVPVVVAVAEGGKAAFLHHRSAEIAGLLAGCVAVCLPDLRGLGETRPEGSRGRWGSITSHASTELMLGGTFVGARLRDLRAVLAYLRGRVDVDRGRIALWGDSFARANPPDTEFEVPRNVDGRPGWSEPLGGLLALLGALYDDTIRAVHVRGGLSDFCSVLASPFVYIPHDVVIPGVLRTGDLCDVAAALTPRSLWLAAMVDGVNRQRSDTALRELYRPALESYRESGAAQRIAVGAQDLTVARWFLDELSGN